MSQRNMLSYLGLRDNKEILPGKDSKEGLLQAEYPTFQSLQIEIPQFLVEKGLRDAFKESFAAHVQDFKKTDLSQWVADVTRPGSKNKRVMMVQGRKVPENLTVDAETITDSILKEHEAYLIKELTVQGKDLLIKQHNQAYIGFSVFLFNDILTEINKIPAPAKGGETVSCFIDVSFNQSKNQYIVTLMNKDMPAVSPEDIIGGPYHVLFSKDSTLGFQQTIQPVEADYKETRKLVTNDPKIAMALTLSYLKKLEKNEVKPTVGELERFHGFFLAILDELISDNPKINMSLAGDTFLEYLTAWSLYQEKNNVDLTIRDEKSIKTAVNFATNYLQYLIENEKDISAKELQWLTTYFSSVADQMNPFSKRIATEQFFELFCRFQINKHKMLIPPKSSASRLLRFMNRADEKSAVKDIHGLQVEAWDYIRKIIVKEKEFSNIVDILGSKIDKIPEDLLIIYLVNVSVFFQAQAVLENNTSFPNEGIKKFFRDAANPENLFKVKEFLDKYPDASTRQNKVIEKLDLMLKNVDQFKRKLAKMETDSLKKINLPGGVG